MIDYYDYDYDYDYDDYGIVDKEEMEKLAQLEKERESRMHGVVESSYRDTGDMQDEDVKVGTNDDDQ